MFAAAARIFIHPATLIIALIPVAVPVLRLTSAKGRKKKVITPGQTAPANAASQALATPVMPAARPGLAI